MTINEQRRLIVKAQHQAGGAQELAAVLGVRPSTVYRWMNGTRRMHAISARAILAYLAEKH